MSARAELPQARQLLRLRDAGYDAALRALAAARSAAEAAALAEQAAIDVEAHAAAEIVAARARLCGDPATAPARLACLDLAVERQLAAAKAVIDAREARATADDAVRAAMAALLKAQARRDAMGERTGQLRRAVARGVENHAANESEETMASRRIPA